ncbi:MAG: hypothetical protein QM736_10385 [Vicinamibacterales bacterium]
MATGRPTWSIKAPEYTMPAVSQDQWWRPVSDIPVTEPRWVRMVEIASDQHSGARKILHHSIAYHILSPRTPDCRQHRYRWPSGVGCRVPQLRAPADLVNRRP